MASRPPLNRILGGAVLRLFAESAVDSLRTSGRTLAAALFPARCAACGRPGAALCVPCLETATPLPHPQCRQCTRPLAYGDQCARCRLERRRINHLYAPYAYTPPILQAVQRFKYGNKRYLAADLAALAMPALPADLQVDCVVPVPLTASRERQRGYNQSRLLASTRSRGVSTVRWTAPCSFACATLRPRPRCPGRGAWPTFAVPFAHSGSCLAPGFCWSTMSRQPAQQSRLPPAHCGVAARSGSAPWCWREPPRIKPIRRQSRPVSTRLADILRLISRPGRRAGPQAAF